jgi:hypothetical protein
VARWMMQAAASTDLGYIPAGGAIHEADALLVARPVGGAETVTTPASGNSVDDAALDDVRRAHFLYGLEEIQAMAVPSARP